MARSKLTNPTEDLNQDSGSILWSIVKGEQLEFPIILNFIENFPVIIDGIALNPASRYTYEAVVIEAANTVSETKPTTIQPGGVNNTLNMRVPTYRGNWDASQAYNKENVVYYVDKYYKLLAGIAMVSSELPSVSTIWEETTFSKVYLQFPSSLGSNWAVSPTVEFPTYGFFELRVTEPSDSVFQRTWKPIRGMVEILFSPTDIVPNV